MFLLRETAIGIMQLIVTAYIFFDNIGAAVLLSPYLFFRYRNRKQEKKEQEAKELTLQFKDAMTAISFSLNVGYSVENALREAVKELQLLYGSDGRIVKEFQSIIRRIERNENIEDVLLEFAIKSQVEDILYFAEVFRYAKRSGGDLIGIIKNTAAVIRKKIDVEMQIQTVLSGKKMEQKVMSGMPYGMILYLRISSPEFISPLYGNLFGVLVMSACLAGYVCANQIAKRIVSIHI